MKQTILTLIIILFIGNVYANDPDGKKITYDQFKFQIIHFKSHSTAKPFHITSISKYGNTLPFTILAAGFLIVPDIIVFTTSSDSRIREGILIYDTFALTALTYFLIEQYYY